MTQHVVLASSSPRRYDLLAQLGLHPEVVAPDVDETVHPGEDPVAYVQRVALDKCMAVEAPANALVIAADTTVVLAGEILAKPDDDEHARRMLRALSGRTHRVHTGVAVRVGPRSGGRSRVDVCTTLVTFIVLSDEQIDWYVGTGEPRGKAGAYAVQGAGGMLVQIVRGSVSNVVGLPLHTLARMTTELGVSLTGLR